MSLMMLTAASAGVVDNKTMRASKMIIGTIFFTLDKCSAYYDRVQERARRAIF